MFISQRIHCPQPTAFLLNATIKKVFLLSMSRLTTSNILDFFIQGVDTLILKDCSIESLQFFAEAFVLSVEIGWKGKETSITSRFTAHWSVEKSREKGRDIQLDR